MLAIALLLSLATEPDPAFSDNMVGLWNSQGTIIVVTSGSRAHAFDDSGKKYVQWRDGYLAPDGSSMAAVLVRDSISHEGGTPNSPSRIRIVPNSYTPFKPIEGGIGIPNGVVKIKIGPPNSSGQPNFFDWQLFSFDTRTPLSSGKAWRCGKTSDIQVSGTYLLGKSISVTINPSDSDANPQLFTGTLAWNDHVYDLTGHRDYTHLYWEARLHDTGEKLADGYAEWDPQASDIPERGGEWKPTSRIFFQAEGQAFGSPRSMTLTKIG